MFYFTCNHYGLTPAPDLRSVKIDLSPYSQLQPTFPSLVHVQDRYVSVHYGWQGCCCCCLAYNDDDDDGNYNEQLV